MIDGAEQWILKDGCYQPAAVRHLQAIGKNDRWVTPQDLFDTACTEFGVYPKLDVCAEFNSAKCKKYITPEQDALKEQWGVDFFMNPPYSKIQQWMSYADSMQVFHNVNALILTFAKTDTAWWHDFVENRPRCKVKFVRGRIHFFEPDTGRESRNGAPYPSCWIAWYREGGLD